jgi:hypothetical protein
MSFECEYCNKTFSTKSNLSLHKKTTKRCLKIQAEIGNETSNNTFLCNYCNKNFSLKHNYDVHISSCKNKKELNKKETLEQLLLLKDELIKHEEQRRKEKMEYELLQIKYKDLENQNEKLKSDLEKEKKRTAKTIYNIKVQNIVNQLPAMTNENIKGSFLEHVNTDSLSKGTNRFIMDFTNMAKEYSVIADMSRGKLIAKDEKGERVDIQFESFVKSLFKMCEEQGLQLTEETLQEIKNKEADKIFDNLNIKRTNEIYDIQHAFRESSQDRDHKILNEVVNRLKKQGKLISK